MAFGPDYRPDNRFELRTGRMTGAEAYAAGIDVGLRKYMLGVYNYMASGLTLTGIVALGVASSQAALQLLFGTGLSWLVMLAPLAFIMVLSFGVHKLRTSTLHLVFWAFCAVMGLSMASIFIQFTGEGIARAFFITAGTFAGMSLYGYVTKRDLSSMGSFLFMGLIGVVIAGVINIFLQSSALHFAASLIGVLVFVGFTAYDTQRIKDIYREADCPETQGKKSIMGAVALYLDFINLFMLALQFFANRR